MPSLEEIMGSSYRADMTQEEVTAYFKNQLLSGGEYVSKAKADADKSDSAKKIADLEAKLNGNLSDEEKKAAEFQALQEEIKALKESGRLSKLETAQLKAEGTLAEARILLDIKADDKEYKALISNISAEDSAKTESIGKYISKLVKDAYEKGKAESTKKNLGAMGTQFMGGQTDKEVSKDLAMVEKIKASKPAAKQFKNSNFN